MLVQTTSARNLFEIHHTETKEAVKTKTYNNATITLNSEVADVKSKCKSLVRTCEMLKKVFAECVAEAERKWDIKIISKPNALKRKLEENKESIEKLVENVGILQEKRKPLK